MSTSRYTVIEETAMLQNDSPLDDFACHFYMTRYVRLRGIVQHTFADLRTSVKQAISDSMDKNSVDLPRLTAKGMNPMAWSMNWYRLRNKENRMYQLTHDEKVLISEDYVELKEQHPFSQAQIHIFQKDDSDMVLIAVALLLDDNGKFVTGPFRE